MYDLIIIGSGPAGLTASIYASRYKLSNLVIGKILGGTITWAHKVENFPGFKEISGMELGQKMVEQAKSLGAEMIGEEVGRIETEGSGEKSFKVVTESNKEFLAKTLIVTTGTERRKLGVFGEKEYLGKGVSYCTNCDAPLFKDKIVALIGGSNAAVGGAVHAAEFASKVYIIYRKDQLRADPAWVEEAIHNSKVEVVYNTNILKILGSKDLEDLDKLKIKNEKLKMTMQNLKIEGVGERVVGVELDKEYQGETFLPVDGVFIEIGGVPASSFLVPLGVKLDENDYVQVNEKMETNIPGLFAAGDVTTHSQIMSQAITSCADGAIAAGSAYKYLKGIKAPKITGDSKK